MPHVYVDYSANLENRADIAGLCTTLRLAAGETAVFPMAGIRVRAFRADHVSIADGSDIHAYVHIMIRLRSGRDLDARKQATQHVFEAARRFLEPVMEASSLALSLEMIDIDPELSPKCGTIRDHMNSPE